MPPGAPNAMPPHGPAGPMPGRGMVQGGLGPHVSGPGGPGLLPGQQHQGMAPRGPSAAMSSSGVPPGGPMHPGAMQQGMRPQGMNADVPMSEPERIVIGHRVTVPNMEVANAAMRPPGFNAMGAAAAAAAAAQGANLAAAAAAAARQQQFPYGQQYPYDAYSAMYGAEWQLMQQQRDAAYAAAAAYGLDKHAKVSRLKSALQKSDWSY